MNTPFSRVAHALLTQCHGHPPGVLLLGGGGAREGPPHGLFTQSSTLPVNNLLLDLFILQEGVLYF
jgi:hypothetical protein